MPLCKAPRVLNLFRASRAIFLVCEMHPNAYMNVYITRAIATLADIREEFWVGKDIGHPNGEILLAKLVESCPYINGGYADKGVVDTGVILYNENLDLDKFLKELEFRLLTLINYYSNVEELTPADIYTIAVPTIADIFSKYSVNKSAHNTDIR